MRMTAALVAGLAVSATPLIAQEQDMSAPQEAAPANSSQPPSSSDDGMAGSAGAAMAGGAGYWADASPEAIPGPLYGQLEYLREVVSKQGAYITALEKHVAALDSYIASLRTGRH